MNPSLPHIATDVVDWQATHGRNHLPWQQTRDPYRVWLSEIMLQQTQVSTVLGYYERFLSCFPDVASLASAPEEDVMALWSGLGYYSRARNLHKCAQTIMREHGGRFPNSAAVLATLPGIGRSTAAAIASFCFAERAAILDANVKRVLTRVLAYDADLSSARSEKTLWTLAENMLPITDLQHAMPRYTQGLMDLGATICLPRTPNCLLCPLNHTCKASQQGNPQSYPVKTRKTKRSSQAWWLLILRDEQDQIWMERRPSSGGDSGIWAGLYSPPVFSSAQMLETTLTQLPVHIQQIQHWPAQLHVLTHRDLFLHPVVVDVLASSTPMLSDTRSGNWQTPASWKQAGLPAPIRKLMDELSSK